MYMLRVSFCTITYLLYMYAINWQDGAANINMYICVTAALQFTSMTLRCNSNARYTLSMK